MNCATGLFLNGELVCNASIRLIAACRDTEDGNTLWLLIEVNLGSHTQAIRWRASEPDSLNLEREVPGTICADGRGEVTKRAIATYLRAQITELNVPYGQYIAATGWHEINGSSLPPAVPA